MPKLPDRLGLAARVRRDALVDWLAGLQDCESEVIHEHARKCTQPGLNNYTTPLLKELGVNFVSILQVYCALLR